MTNKAYPLVNSPSSDPTGSKWDRFRRFLEIVSSAGELIMSVPEKPTPLSWFGFGLRGANLAFKVRAEVDTLRTREPYAYFSANTGVGLHRLHDRRVAP